MNLNSSDFISKIKLRDHDAVTILITKYNEVLIKGALKQGLAFDQADEVVQETWSTFFEKVENFEGRSHIRTYLFGILYNKIKELWRSNKKYTQDDDATLEKSFNEFGHYLVSPLNPQLFLESSEFMSILQQELDNLPINQKMAFNLKEIEQFSTDEICKILEISVTNLGVLLFRAKANLRKRIENRYI